MTEYKLILFDVDGTLVGDYNSYELLPDVIEKLSTLKGADFALVSNQGGVGLRYWMTVEGFGEPEKYPTQFDAAMRIRSFANRIMLRIPQSWCSHYVAFAYQSKRSGKWGPVPLDGERDPRWAREWRKPDAGMLQQAMEDADVEKRDMLFVGDSEEDEQAAATFGIDFIHAKDFFGRTE